MLFLKESEDRVIVDHCQAVEAQFGFDSRAPPFLTCTASTMDVPWRNYDLCVKLLELSQVFEYALQAQSHNRLFLNNGNSQWTSKKKWARSKVGGAILSLLFLSSLDLLRWSSARDQIFIPFRVLWSCMSNLDVCDFEPGRRDKR